MKTCIITLTLIISALFLRADDYQPPALSDADSWSMILLPDTQTYQKFSRNQGIFDIMTAWIEENVESLNIQMVLCVGDLVEQNDMIDPQGVKVNQTSRQQWEAVSRAFSRLDNRVPYIAATGNHDYGYRNISNRRTHYTEYFTVERNMLSQRLLKSVTLNAQNEPSLENAFYEFTSPHGKKFFFIVIEFAPRNEVLDWAKEIVSREEYKNHTGILLTHSYLNADAELIVKENYPIKEGNYGAAIWSKLVEPSSNIEMVFCGHIAKPDDIDAHIAFRNEPNQGEKMVHQMLFNAQALGGGWYGNGGDGWLRILEFMPDGKTVKVKTFSPFFAISPTTQEHAWRVEEKDTFEFTLASIR